MNLPEIKQLRELLKLLRSQGVLQYQSTDLNLILSEKLQETKSKAVSDYEVLSDEEDLTPEQEAERLLFYSATPPSEPSEQ